MKIESLKFIVIVLGLSLLFSCSSHDLENVDNMGTFPTEEYFKTEDQSYSALVGIYDHLVVFSGTLDNMNIFFNAGSDDAFSGGGSSSDIPSVQSISNYSVDAQRVPRDYWTEFYQGIAQANLLLERIDETEMDDNLKSRFIAEAKVLRSFYYFQLLRMFGRVPLILQTFEVEDDYFDVLQANPQEVYDTIESDIMEALSALPKTVSGDERGRITEGSARAILGKIYLYDGKDQEAAEQFRIVNGTPGEMSDFGYSLLTDFADLWRPGSESNFNSESILEVVHSDESESGNDPDDFGRLETKEGNMVVTIASPRNYTQLDSSVPDGIAGFGFDVVTSELADFLRGDPRYKYTIFEAKQLEEDGRINYQKSYRDTGYFLYKFLGVTEEFSTKPGSATLNIYRNYMIIRLADTYLMEAEALGAEGARAQALLDAVRARVGLPSVPVSMKAIKDERRRELAGEGIRWFDLVRWGDAPEMLRDRGFIEGKNELLPIPFQDLANTQLEQNPGY